MDKNRTCRSSNIPMDDFSRPLISKKKLKRYWRKRKIKRRLLNIALFFVIAMLMFLVAVLAFHSRGSEHNIEKYSIAETECGLVQGVIESFGTSSALVFKGIPFAMPPVGSRRWKPSRSMKPDFCWKAILKTDKFQAPCYQFNQEKEVGSEDCLYVDVWTPKFNSTQSLPVMVLMSGVDQTIGPSQTSGIIPNVEFVVGMKIVAVRINYRLNAFGFLALDVLSKYSKSHTSGNYGLMDQIMALRWVKSNIHAFRGDPSKVTVVGHGSGATSIFGLLASKKAKGLFSRAIVMSGSTFFSKSAKMASKDNEIFLQNTKCKNQNEKGMLECLYKLNASEILHAIPWFMYPKWGMADFTDPPKNGIFDGSLCVVDGDIVTTPPGELKKVLAMPHNITLLIGTTAQETALHPAHNFTGKSLGELVKFLEEKLEPFSVELPKRAIKVYKTMLNSSDPQLIYTMLTTDVRVTCPVDHISLNLSNVDNLNVYRYVVTNRPSKPARFSLKPTRYSAHIWDLSALFGFRGMPYGYKPTQRDLNFRDTIRKVFLEFLETGKPGIAAWKTYPSRVGIFGDERLTVEKDFHKTTCKLWNEYNIFKYG